MLTSQLVTEVFSQISEMVITSVLFAAAQSLSSIKCDGLRRERMFKWTILSFDVVQLRWAELLEGWPLGVEATFMVVDSNVDGAARWGRRIRQNSITNCFHDGIIDVILNIWWDRRGFMQIDYVCRNFKFRWKRRCRKTGRTSQLSASLSAESTKYFDGF